jgi:serine phosphatase RsbU (regulator of sigma subunit)
VLAFTDGVTEAGATQGPQFQHGPLQALLAGLPDNLSADEVVARLLAGVQAHAGTAWPEDDTTILCLNQG